MTTSAEALIITNFPTCFCDISKAFDRGWHKGLIYKLKQHDVEGDFLKWFTDTLIRRQQKVIIRGCASSLKVIKACVPQGSVLGPLSIYVNSIADYLLSLTRLLADDSSLVYSASSLDDIQYLINHNLILLSQCAKQWIVTFNPSKTEAVLFTLRNCDHVPLLKFENTHVKFVESLRWQMDRSYTLC